MKLKKLVTLLALIFFCGGMKNVIAQLTSTIEKAEDAHKNEESASSAFKLIYALSRPTASQGEIDAAFKQWTSDLDGLGKVSSKKTSKQAVIISESLKKLYFKIYDEEAIFADALLSGRYNQGTGTQLYILSVDYLNITYRLRLAPDHTSIALGNKDSEIGLYVEHPDCSTNDALRMSEPAPEFQKTINFSVGEAYWKAAEASLTDNPETAVQYSERLFEILQDASTRQFYGSVLFAAAQAESTSISTALKYISSLLWLAGDDQEWVTEAFAVFDKLIIPVVEDESMFEDLLSLYDECSIVGFPDKHFFEIRRRIATLIARSYSMRQYPGNALYWYVKLGSDNIPFRFREDVERQVTSMVDLALTDQAALDTLEKYVARFMWFKTSQTIRSADAFVRARRVSRHFTVGEEEKGLIWLADLEAKHIDVTAIPHARNTIGQAYADASAFYVRNKRNEEAKAILARGLIKLPEDTTMLRRQKMLLDAEKGKW